MARCTLSALLGSLLLVGTACQQSADRTADGHQAAATAAADSHATPATPAGDEHAASEHAASEHAASAHAAEGEGGMALLPIMQGLGTSMTALTYALMTDDHATVAKSASAIATHAPISAEELQRIARVLGSDMRAFEAVDESVHVASVRLHEAAQARQPDQVVTRLGEVQRGCVSCHAQFRERLRADRMGS